MECADRNRRFHVLAFDDDKVPTNAQPVSRRLKSAQQTRIGYYRPVSYPSSEADSAENDQRQKKRCASGIDEKRERPGISREREFHLFRQQLPQWHRRWRCGLGRYSIVTFNGRCGDLHVRRGIGRHHRDRRLRRPDARGRPVYQRQARHNENRHHP